jgi:hypothetical protein
MSWFSRFYDFMTEPWFEEMYSEYCRFKIYGNRDDASR